MSSDDTDGPSMRRFSELPESDGRLSKDLVYTVLSNVRRRYLLLTLIEGDGRSDVSDLIDSVAAREYGEPVAYDERKRVYVSLRQTHLPTLDEADVVDYDPDRGEVRPGDHFETVTLPLRLVREPLGLLLPVGLRDVPPVSRVARLVPGYARRPTAPMGGTAAGTDSMSHGLAAALELARVLL